MWGLTNSVRRLTETASRQQHNQRTLLNWLRVEYDIAKPSNKLLAVAELDSNTWVSEVKRIQGKKQPLPWAIWISTRCMRGRRTITRSRS
jgi:hypothetical protein